MKKINRVYKQLSGFPLWALLVIGVIWRLLINIICHPNKSAHVSIDTFTSWTDTISILIIAPLWETLVYQMGVIEIYKFFSNKEGENKYPLFSVLISAVLFGVAHFYGGINKIVDITLIGVYFGFLYITISTRYSDKWKGYWATATLHFLNNLITLLLIILLRAITH